MTLSRRRDSASWPPSFGPGNALSTLKVDTTLSTMTVEQWLAKHIDDLTGVDRGTVAKYRAYLKNDIGPVLGSLPLFAHGGGLFHALCRRDVGLGTSALARIHVRKAPVWQ
jgi:hypothetical protein